MSLLLLGEGEGEDSIGEDGMCGIGEDGVLVVVLVAVVVGCNGVGVGDDT